MKERDLHTLSRELKAHLYEVRRERDATVARYDALIDSILRLLGGIALVSGPPAGGTGDLAGGRALLVGGLYPLPLLLEGQPAVHLPAGRSC